MKKSRMIFYGLAIGILISFLYALLPKGHPISHASMCMNNLKQLGLALIIYAEDNQGMLPYLNGKKGLDMALIHNEFNAQELLFCPKSKLNYIYYGGISVKDITKPDKYPLIWEDGFPHHDKKAVLFVDCHAELLDEKQWKNISR